MCLPCFISNWSKFFSGEDGSIVGLRHMHIGTKENVVENSMTGVGNTVEDNVMCAGICAGKISTVIWFTLC